MFSLSFFSLNLQFKIISVYMKKLCKFLVLLAVTVVVTFLSSSCFRQDYVMFEDGDFDGMEFSDYDLMHNAELDMDDVDRD